MLPARPRRRDEVSQSAGGAGPDSRVGQGQRQPASYRVWTVRTQYAPQGAPGCGGSSCRKMPRACGLPLDRTAALCEQQGVGGKGRHRQKGFARLQHSAAEHEMQKDVAVPVWRTRPLWAKAVQGSIWEEKRPHRASCCAAAFIFCGEYGADSPSIAGSSQPKPIFRAGADQSGQRTRGQCRSALHGGKRRWTIVDARRWLSSPGESAAAEDQQDGSGIQCVQTGVDRRIMLGQPQVGTQHS